MIFLLTAVYAARVAAVNMNAVRVPTYTYEKGEVVDFGQDYIDSIDDCSPGYAGYQFFTQKGDQRGFGILVISHKIRYTKENDWYSGFLYWR